MTQNRDSTIIFTKITRARLEHWTLCTDGNWLSKLNKMHLKSAKSLGKGCLLKLANGGIVSMVKNI